MPLLKTCQKLVNEKLKGTINQWRATHAAGKQIPQYILEGDEKSIQAFQDKYKSKEEHRLELRQMPELFIGSPDAPVQMPELFIGSPDAPVWIINHNPAVGTINSSQKLPWDEEFLFQAQCRQLLLETETPKPPAGQPQHFFMLDQRMTHNATKMDNGYKWWRTRLLGSSLPPSNIRFCQTVQDADLFFAIELHGYHSKHFKLPTDYFCSMTEITLKIIEMGAKNGKTMLITRGHSFWINPDPCSPAYKAQLALAKNSNNVFFSSSPQNASISRNNVITWEAKLQANLTKADRERAKSTAANAIDQVLNAAKRKKA